jgi:hypothetical protein
VDQAAIEYSLHGDIFGLGRRVNAIAAWTEVNERSTAAVLENEKMSEIFGHAAFHRDRTAFLHCADGHRLKQRDTSRLPTLCKPGAARAGGDTDGEHSKHGAHEHRFVTTPKKVGSRRSRWRGGVLFGHCKSPVVFVHRPEHTDGRPIHAEPIHSG